MTTIAVSLVEKICDAAGAQPSRPATQSDADALLAQFGEPAMREWCAYIRRLKECDDDDERAEIIMRGRQVVRSAAERALFDQIDAAYTEMQRETAARITADIRDLERFMKRSPSLAAAEAKRNAAARIRAVKSHPQRLAAAHEAGHAIVDIELGVPLHSLLVRSDGSGVVRSYSDHLPDEKQLVAFIAGAVGECIMGVSREVKMRGDGFECDLPRFMECLQRITGERDLDCWAAREAQYEAFRILNEHSLALFVLAERGLQTVDVPVPGEEVHRLFDENDMTARSACE